MVDMESVDKNSPQTHYYQWVTFVFALRKSSTGLILGIITHLVILLGKFMMPVNRPQSKKNVIYLEGMCMYPSGDVSLFYLTKTKAETKLKTRFLTIVLYTFIYFTKRLKYRLYEKEYDVISKFKINKTIQT